MSAAGERWTCPRCGRDLEGGVDHWPAEIDGRPACLPVRRSVAWASAGEWTPKVERAGREILRG